MNLTAQVAERYVRDAMALDPVSATLAGISGFDDQMADLTPDGFEARAELDRRTIAAIREVAPASEPEQVARTAMLERLGLAVEQYDAGETTSEISVIASWMHSVRAVFDLMPVEGEQAQRDLAARMAAVPGAYAGLRRTYAESAAQGRVAARRQIEGCAKKCASWSAADGGFYAALAGRAGATGSLRAQLGQAAYSWGWAEVGRIEVEMARVAGQIVPGGTVEQAVAALEADPARRITGRENLRSWMQDYADGIMSGLHGTHFDIPEPARRIEAMIAPVNGGGIYYSGPSEDWSRPGRIWWSPPDGIDEFSTWQEISTIHHEGVPGHHLQIAEGNYRTDRLNRWQRTLSFVSGHGEGWALYAERLMDELGYLDDPGNRLGMLDQQLLHAAQVVIDIGVHLELPVPPGTGWHDGQTWNAELAWEFLRSHSRYPDAILRFELDRYLGWPGQATSYKLGERIWLQAREDARQRQGTSFDLKEFHSQALALGSLGLDPLREALARL
jgi:uncharacterized protein (DUF885 family)